jgi:hypothetical protein
MREAETSFRNAGPLTALRMTTVCCVQGCDALVFDGDYCARCADELHALEALARLRRMRRVMPAAVRFRYLCRRVGKWLWVPTWLFNGAGIAYFVFEFFTTGG